MGGKENEEKRGNGIEDKCGNEVGGKGQRGEE